MEDLREHQPSDLRGSGEAVPGPEKCPAREEPGGGHWLEEGDEVRHGGKAPAPATAARQEEEEGCGG
jgi:hypothetical protein